MFISLKQFFVICFVLLKTASGVPIAYLAADNQTFMIEINPTANWVTAYQICRSLGGYLAIIDSLYKYEVLIKLLIDKFGNVPELWLGANDEINVSARKGRRFRWAFTGQDMIFSKWHKYDPDNAGFNEHCVSMKYTLEWYDSPCDREAGYVCDCICEKCRQMPHC